MNKFEIFSKKNIVEMSCPRIRTDTGNIVTWLIVCMR